MCHTQPANDEENELLEELPFGYSVHVCLYCTGIRMHACVRARVCTHACTY